MFYVYLFLDFGQLHAVFPETILPSLLYICDSLHGLNCLNIQVSVVLLRSVPLLLEIVNWIVYQFLVMQLAISFGPRQFSGVVFGLEVAVALWAAETEILTVVAHEHDSVTRVDGS